MAAPKIAKLSTHIVHHTKGSCSGSVIFLHGEGQTGGSVRETIRSVLGREWAFPHVRVVYPTAEDRSDIIVGQVRHEWLHRDVDNPAFREILESSHVTLLQLAKVMEAEVRHGIPRHRILIGGFSMGGTMALHVAYRFQRALAGVFCLGGYLSSTSPVYEVIKGLDAARLPALFQAHGANDTTVKEESASQTFARLRELGVNGEYHVILNQGHELSAEQLTLLSSWVESMLPQE